MSKIRVIGIGSPFGDDRVGWEVIQLLKENKTIQENPFIQLMCCDRPGINLLHLMQNAAHVLLIDAVKTGAALGTCHVFNQTKIMQLYSSLSTHEIGLGYTLQLGETLHLLPPNITLYGIEINAITQNENSLSPPVQKAVKSLCDIIQNVLRDTHKLKIICQ